ncbi:hypothetical protein K402DRAFT_422392 [Aulographum hederae CBS 113979]|uniref:SUN domain-containing protein n=1 Tax=Aulographum hederae CBS 113979 TaxID=1176131 RepID=A0A6G1GWC3_9PEZI|nr:hypothetical protein K402DRAFT_422392 [Aulographum hederae CBS 113979]
MSANTPRRSARITRASATPAPVPQPVAATATSTSRRAHATTRAPSGPRELPAVRANVSQGYGSVAKPVLAGLVERQDVNHADLLRSLRDTGIESSVFESFGETPNISRSFGSSREGEILPRDHWLMPKTQKAQQDRIELQRLELEISEETEQAAESAPSEQRGLLSAICRKIQGAFEHNWTKAALAVVLFAIMIFYLKPASVGTTSPGSVFSPITATPASELTEYTTLRNNLARLEHEFYAMASDSRTERHSLDRAVQILDTSFQQFQKAAAESAIMHPHPTWESLREILAFQNYHHALITTNFFSPGLGAVVNPYLTSVTMDTAITWNEWFRRKLFIDESPPTPNSPMNALTSWEEPTDCWCASQSNGKSQIAIQMPMYMHPTEFTVEHVPKSATPDANTGSAPKFIEIWADVSNPNDASAKVNLADLNKMKAPEHRCSKRSNEIKDYECLGRFMYHPDSPNWVQTFQFDDYGGLSIQKVIVRVVENWGEEFTCLYRVRMHGKKADREENKDMAHRPSRRY